MKNEMLSRFAMAKAVLEDTREAAVSAVSEHAWAIDAAQKDLKRFTDIITDAGLEATPEALRAALQGLKGCNPAPEAAPPAAVLSIDLPRTQRIASDRDHLPDLPAKEEDGEPDATTKAPPLTPGDRVRIARAPFCTGWPADRWEGHSDDFGDPLGWIGATGIVAEQPKAHKPLAADEVYVEADDSDHPIGAINVSCLEPE